MQTHFTFSEPPDSTQLQELAEAIRVLFVENEEFRPDSIGGIVTKWVVSVEVVTHEGKIVDYAIDPTSAPWEVMGLMGWVEESLTYERAQIVFSTDEEDDEDDGQEA